MQASTSWSIVAWDRKVALSAGLATLLGFALALLVTAGTDEGGVTWAERASRALGALPLAAGFATWLALEARRARGELTALAALGRSPRRCGVAALVGALFAAVTLTTVVTSRASFDNAVFFPTVRTSTTHFAFRNDAFVDDAAGLRVGRDGSMSLDVPSAPVADATAIPNVVRRSETIAVIAMVLLASLAFALIGARGRPNTRDFLAVAFTVAASIAVLHGVAVHRLPLVVAVFPEMALIVYAALRYGERAWQSANEV